MPIRATYEKHDPMTGYRSFALTPASFNAEARTVEGVAATENPVLVPDWNRMAMVPEVLLMDGLADALPKKVPLLDTHDATSVKAILGSSMLRLEGDQLIATRTLATGDPEADKALQKIKDGHITDGSIRYQVLEDRREWVDKGETRSIAGREFVGPVAVITKWTVKEDSICPIGADVDAKMRCEASASAETLKGQKMDEKLRKQLEALGLRSGATDEEAKAFLEATLNKPAPKPAPPAEVTPEMKAEIAAAERKRTAEILQIGEIAGCRALADKFILEGADVDKARAAIYAEWQKKGDKAVGAPAKPDKPAAAKALDSMDTKTFARALTEMPAIEVDGGGLSINQMRQIALSEPKAWADKMRQAIEAKDLTLAKIQPHMKAIQTALYGVMVDEIVDTPVGKRAISASAFPVLCGNTIVAGITAAYNETPGISDQLVEEMDDNNALTRYASLRTWDSKEEAWREGEDKPLVGMGEDWVEGREKPMARRIEILQTAIDRNQVNIVSYANALGKFAKNWVEKLTISRVCDQYGSAGSATEPYVYRPSGTGTTLYSASANTPGTRAPSGTSVASNSLADYTDLDAARAVLVAMKDENAERISFSWNDIILLVPDAVYYIALRNLGSEYMPVPDTTFNSATLNHWGPRGAFRPKLLSSPKLDDISTSTWFMGNFKAQFMRKWARRFQYMTLGQETESMLKRGVAFQASMDWNCDVFAKDYVYVVRNTA